MSETPPGGQHQAFSPVTALWVVLVGIFAFSAFVALLAYAPDLQRDPACRSNVYSRCAIGFAGLMDAVKASGEPVLISRRPLPKGPRGGLLIVTPEPLRGEDIAGLGYGGPVLVVLPKWQAVPDLLHQGWGRKAGLIPPGMMPSHDVLAGVGVARRAGVSRPRLQGDPAAPTAHLMLAPGPIDSFQTLTVKDWIPVLTDDEGRVVMAQMPRTRIYVLADPDLLNTQGLANPDTFAAAAALLRVMRVGDAPMIFDVTLNGYKSDLSVLRLVFDPPFLAVTLCLAAAVALAGVQTAFRFGPIRREGRAFALGKEALADNSAQLIRLAHREAAMAAPYAALTRSAAARAVGAPRDLGGEALTSFLDRLARQRGAADSLADLTADAARVRTRAGVAEIAQKLFRWRLEMTRERQ